MVKRISKCGTNINDEVLPLIVQFLDEGPPRLGGRDLVDENEVQAAKVDVWCVEQDGRQKGNKPGAWAAFWVVDRLLAV